MSHFDRDGIPSYRGVVDSYSLNRDHLKTNKHVLIITLQAYHSQFLEINQSVGNTAILPIKTQFRGPAPPCASNFDIIDEAIYFFRANVFFRTYEIKVGCFKRL